MAAESTDFSRHMPEHSSALVAHLAPALFNTSGNRDGNSNNSSVAVTPTTDHSKLLKSPSADQANQAALATKLEEVAERRPDRDGDEETERFYCGCRSCRPKFLQVFANAKFFTFMLCVYAFIQGAIVSGEHVFGELVSF